MFISAFYAVIDPNANELRFANTGHPHAFLLADEMDFERLAATDLPIGMDDRQPATVRRPWNPHRDLLVLFTDGVSDARNRRGDRLGEERVLETIREHREATPEVILDRVMEVLDKHTGRSTRRDDLTVVLVRA
jgi:sigma-B regulation protein RsbU (phosphoserine phosphatase)